MADRVKSYTLHIEVDDVGGTKKIAFVGWLSDDPAANAGLSREGHNPGKPVDLSAGELSTVLSSFLEDCLTACKSEAL